MLLAEPVHFSKQPNVTQKEIISKWKELGPINMIEIDANNPINFDLRLNYD